MNFQVGSTEVLVEIGLEGNIVSKLNVEVWYAPIHDGMPRDYYVFGVNICFWVKYGSMVAISVLHTPHSSRSQHGCSTGSTIHYIYYSLQIYPKGCIHTKKKEAEHPKFFKWHHKPITHPNHAL